MKFSSLRIRALRAIDLRLLIRILSEAWMFYESLSDFFLFFLVIVPYPNNGLTGAVFQLMLAKHRRI
jgi:hypothetical protein